MDNKTTSKIPFLIYLVLLLMGTILACLSQSSSSTHQESILLPATPTKVQPTQTIILPESESTNVSIPQRNHISPDVLAPSLMWSGGGGGGTTQNCEDGIPNIYFLTYGDNTFPDQPFLGNDLSLGEVVDINGCDFPNDDNIAVTFYFPDGQSDTYNVLYTENGYWTFTWYSLPSDPMGQYDVEVVSKTGTYTGQFFVSEPTKPTMLTLCFSNEAEGEVFLTGFQPDEEVLIARYTIMPYDLDTPSPPNLIDYFYITIDHQGFAYFNIPNESTILIAIGQETPAYFPFSDLLVSAFDRCYSY